MTPKHVLPVVGAVSDMGHSFLKMAVRGEDGWRDHVEPHAMHELPEKEWLGIVERSRSHGRAQDYVRINGKCYVMGDSAERRGHSTRMTGAKRYTKEYIAVQALWMIALTCPYYEAEVSILALHPPADSRYAKRLAKALKGTWNIELGTGDEMFYAIDKVRTLDEPVAGFMNVALDIQRGEVIENPGVTANEVLVIDIGGGTTNVAPILPGGEVDYGRIGGRPMGINDVLHNLERGLMDKFDNMLLGTRKIPDDRLRSALLNDKFRGGGRTMGCKDETSAAKAPLLDEIERMYFNGSIGGPMGFDMIVFSGGGPVPLGDDLRRLVDHTSIHYAASNEEMHLANLYGAVKVFELLVQQEVIRL